MEHDMGGNYSRLSTWLPSNVPFCPTCGGDGHFQGPPFLRKKASQGYTKRTVLGLLEPWLIFGKSGIISGAGAVTELDLALCPPALASQALTLFAPWKSIIA